MIKPLFSYIVTAKLPEQIEKIKDIAYNYWWCWNSDAKEMFIRMNRQLWEDVNHNPVLLINKLSQTELEDLANQADFVSIVNKNHRRYREYMDKVGWFKESNSNPVNCIAYFSTEYGINESFPNYSGGLGILSGDHLKSASDLGIPLIGVGLLYQQGYFRQHLTQNAWQNELYSFNDFFSMPLQRIEQNGKPLTISVDLPEGKCYAGVWKLQVGKVALYLLDTNVTENQIPEFRNITDQLYGGTRETRIQQEIVLGVGGMKALRAMSINPEVVHINEGHAAFALLERTANIMEDYKVDFDTASVISKISSVFTTHTPVPAGNEAFSVDRIQHYFANYHQKLGLNMQEFVKLGQIGDYIAEGNFSMTVLGLKMTAYHNGVSRLHGAVSRKMWKNLWTNFTENEVPISHITNGIHTTTWVAREMSELFDRYISPRWRTETDNNDIWKNIDIIPNEELWREKQRRRVRLVLFAREYLKQRQKEFLGADELRTINEYLDPDVLTIGFARRFATYKRALLLFSDMERLSRIVNNPDKPIQIIIAGKAHPHDVAGKEVIQGIIQRVRKYGLEKKIVFLEDYDMIIARYMVKGCDVWLNNPVRPMEASGTSGMKAGLNGTLNFSILDGWWDESYDGTNGFAIGNGEEYTNYEEQEAIESGALYDTLENLICATFYDRIGYNKLPEKWINMMKRSIQTIAGNFSTMRMLKDYTNIFYLPAAENYGKLASDVGKNAINFKNWKEHIAKEWDKVSVVNYAMLNDGDNFIGKDIKISADVRIGSLSPDEVRVQVVYGGVDHKEELFNTNYSNLNFVRKDGDVYHYEGAYQCSGTGMQGFSIRILPNNEFMINPSDLYLCTWAK